MRAKQRRELYSTLRSFPFYALSAAEKREWIIEQCTRAPHLAAASCDKLAQYVDEHVARAVILAGGGVGFSAARRLSDDTLREFAAFATKGHHSVLNQLDKSHVSSRDYSLALGIVYCACGPTMPAVPETSLYVGMPRFTRMFEMYAKLKDFAAVSLVDIMDTAFTRDMIMSMLPRMVLDPANVVPFFADRATWLSFPDIVDGETAASVLRAALATIPESRMSVYAAQYVNLILRIFFWHTAAMSAVFEHIGGIITPETAKHVAAAGALPHLSRRARVVLAAVHPSLDDQLLDDDERLAAAQERVYRKITANV